MPVKNKVRVVQHISKDAKDKERFTMLDWKQRENPL